MAEVGAYEAKTRFSQLLERAQRGETVTITKHGTPVAQLGPVRTRDQQRISAAVAALRTFAKGRRLDGLTIRELVEEGRR